MKYNQNNWSADQRNAKYTPPAAGNLPVDQWVLYGTLGALAMGLFQLFFC